jgi:arylsulfatase A-like enzyme
MREKPNFLFIITDQHRADHLGCYGNPVLRTPAIDGIAANGVRFDRFYASNPICMPNRATIMTGRMSSLHGVRDNGIPLSLDETTFVELLRAGGYRTALLGKSHLQNFTGLPPPYAQRFEAGRQAPPDQLRDARHGLREGPQYDNEQPADWLAEPAHQVRLPFYGFEHVELCTEHGDNVGGHYLRWLRDKDPDSLKRWGPEHSTRMPDRLAPQARRPAIPAELYPSRYVSERTIAYLEEHARGGSERPFFVQCSFPDPHHPFTPPGKYWDMYSPDSISLPPSFHRPSVDQVPFLRHIHQSMPAGAPGRERGPAFAVTEEEAKIIHALTYGMIGLVDDCVAEVLAALDRLGLREDTVVIFTSDHGDWLGDHGVVLKGPLHYQGLIRVPFIWSDPQAPNPGSVSGELAGSIDIARSVVERAGLAPYQGMQGQAIGEIVLRGARSGHDGMIIEQTTRQFLPGMDRNVRLNSFVDSRWRLSLWEATGWGELYDLANDPHEMRNLWDDPVHRGIREDLTLRMMRATMSLQDWSPLQVRAA